MRIDRLATYNLPGTLIESWKKHQGNQLLPLQAEAVTRYGLLQGRSLLVSSPTSSGKTFYGELAAASHLTRGHKVLYLVPLKAVAEEKYQDFQNKYQKLGLKVLISTRDHPESDFDLERGNVDLAILVYEKFNQLLVNKLALLETLALIVIDELQLVFDPSRGPILERALAKLKMRSSGLQIIGLSSVLDHATFLAEWLGCQLLVQKHRPAELFQGVLWNGVYHYRAHNSLEEVEEKLDWVEENSSQETLFTNLEKLWQREEQALVFMKSKAQVETAALLFTERIQSQEAKLALSELSELEQTSGRDRLKQTLKGRVAFHNADLTYPERKVVERYYLSGEIKIIFCTTTLSLGVNLPAKTVFVEPLKYKNSFHNQKGVLLPLDWSEFENISGRAGRFGQQDSGRAILIANSVFEAERLWENYIEARSVQTAGQLFSPGVAEVILDFAAALQRFSLVSLREYLEKTLTFQIKPIQLELEKVVAKLCENNLLVKSQLGEYQVTNLGRIVALQNLSVSTGLYLHSQIKDYSSDDDFSVIFSLLRTAEARMVYPYLDFSEKKNRVYQKLLAKVIASGAANSTELKELFEKPELVTAEALQSLKTSFLLTDWIRGIETLELEQKYHIRAGQIHQIAEQISWLGSSAALVAEFKAPALYGHLSVLSTRIRYGLTEEGIFLASLKLSGLGRSFIQTLLKAGLSDKESILAAGLENLKRHLPEKLAEKLFDKLNSSEGGGKTESVSPEKETFLVIEVKPVKNKYTVSVNNHNLALTCKSFKYLVKLAYALLTKPEGWLHKEQLESGFNQSRYLHRLKKQLLPYLPAGFNLIENNRLGCYRLNLDKEKVSINWENLEKVEDEEIRSIANQYSALV